MPSTDRFETKRGECRIDGDRLVLNESRRQYLQNLYRGYWQAGEWWRKAIFLGVVLAIPVGVGSVALSALGEGVDVRAVALGVGGIVALLAGLRIVQRRVRGFTDRSEIPLDAITDVSFERGTPGATRPRFVVHYRHDGEERHRYVLLPSLWMPHGEAVAEEAQAVFRQHGIDVEERGGSLRASLEPGTDTE